MHAARLAADFAEHGFAPVSGMLDADEVATLADRVDRLFESGRPRSRQVLYVDGVVPPETPPLDRLLHQWLNPHRFPAGQGTADLLDRPRRVAAAILGAPPVLFQDLLLIKTPEQQRFPWHQDFPFWPVDRPLGVVCWVPLVQNSAVSGGLRFARGSHRLGPLPAVDLHRGRAQDPGASLPAVDEASVICPDLAPGDGLAFSPLILHGSPRRRSTGRRAAWSSIWLHPDVRWCHAHAPAHPICRVVPDGQPVTEWGLAAGGRTA